MLHRIPYRELAQLLARHLETHDARWQAEQAEQGVDPNSLQGRLGSPGSETEGDGAWQAALQQLDRLNTTNARMN